MITVTLSRPIKAHGEEVLTLALNEPTFEQISLHGLPVVTDSNGSFSVNAQVALKYVPVLAGVPPSSLAELTAWDVNNLCWAVWRFFMTPPETLKKTKTS